MKEGKITDKKCKYLVILPSGKTLCRIYKTRFGTRLNMENVCVNREDHHVNYPGCSYNKPEWKEVEKYVED